MQFGAGPAVERPDHRRSGVARTAGLAAALLLAGGAALADCPAALELPVTVRHLHPLVEAVINGQPARLVIDSGASSNLLSTHAARRLGLAGDLKPAGAGQGLDGDYALSATRIGELDLAGRAWRDVPFMVGDGAFDDGAVGLIGQDFLEGAGVDYDLPDGLVRLLPAAACAAPPAGRDWTSVALRPNADGRDVIGEALVNGVPVTVMFDSGGGPSMLSLAAARRAGLTPDDAGARQGDDLQGLGHGRLATWIVPAGSFAIGGERFSDLPLRIGDWGGGTDDGVDMILGGDFFRSHRVIVLPAKGRIFLAYVGGPLFEVGGAEE